MLQSDSFLICTMFVGLLAVAPSGAGCQSQGPQGEGTATMPPEPESEPEAEPIVAKPAPGFSWLVDGLAGLSHPGAATVLSRHLAWMSDEGVDAVVSLTVSGLPAEVVDEHGLRSFHIPVPDGTAPTPEQLDEFIAIVEQAHAQDEAVAVHCLAGLGRTGTMLAAWLVYEGSTADAAMAEVRRQRPGSIETPSQEEALRALDRRLHGDEDDRQ